ncbi:hypothetical protein [Methylobacterium sp. WSM2598]|uniref:hypothetical protein n=1 Tax=Methylobacterium sp. WSM2598 TaxID=398261 RepID=UPI00039C5922|nr:hypothetical protein [Methylobacterium sp. WSM2598]
MLAMVRSQQSEELIRHPVDGFAISHFGHADVGFAQAPRGLGIRHPTDCFAMRMSASLRRRAGS